MNTKPYEISIITFIGLSILLAGCATRNELLQEIDILAYESKFTEARELLAEKKNTIYSKKKDKALFLLDTGLLGFYAKDINTSKKNLQEAETLMEEYRTKSIGETMGSFIINDTVRTYEGESYEYVFTNVILSLGYLIQKDFDGGFVEVRRAQEKIKKIQNDYNIRLEKYAQDEQSKIKLNTNKYAFVDSAFLRLLSFWLYRADNDFTNMEVAIRKYNEAIINQQKIYSFNPPSLDINTILQQDISPKRVQIVALTGRIPFKISHRYSLNTVKNGVIITERIETPTLPSSDIEIYKPTGVDVMRGGAIIPFAGVPQGVGLVLEVPFIAKVQSKIAQIDVVINDIPSGTLQKTESLENIAINAFDVESPLIYAKTIIRAVSKMIIGVGLTNSNNSIAQLFGNIIQIANNFSEKADIRSARYFPAYIWTADIAVPQQQDNTNKYTIALIYKDKNDKILYEENKKINIRNRESSLAIIISSFLQ